VTADEVQYALTYSQRSPFYFRQHYVVPNVHWGLGFNHELDLLSVSMHTLIGTEIEIKVSKGDLKRDLEKEHHHFDKRIRQLYFAGPRTLEGAFHEYVPADAGIITVIPQVVCGRTKYYCSIRRNAKVNKNFSPFKPDEVFQLLRLGNMRYWSQFGKQFKRKNNGNIGQSSF